MTYKQWKQAVFSHINRIPIFKLTEHDFPTVDLKRIYSAGIEPEKAARLVKAISNFTKSEYKIAGIAI